MNLNVALRHAAADAAAHGTPLDEWVEIARRNPDDPNLVHQAPELAEAHRVIARAAQADVECELDEILG